MEITWRERVQDLRSKIGREPVLNELLDLCRAHTMTAAEREEQRQSWVRGMTARCEHGELDFEQCAACRGWN